MNLDRAVERARGERGPKGAATLYNDIEYELAMGDYTEEQAEQAEQALTLLEREHPGVREQARQVTTPPQISHSASRRIRGEHDHGHEHARRPGRSPQANARVEPPRPWLRAPAVPPRVARARQTIGRAASDASPVSGSEFSDAVIGGLQFLLIAGIVYQVLQPKGAGAFGQILSKIGGGVRRFVAPVDPFTGQAPGVAPAPPALTYSPAPAASVSTPGAVTVPGGAPHAQVSPNMFSDPLSGFPLLKIRSPLLATGPAGSHVKAPTSPLSIGG